METSDNFKLAISITGGTVAMGIAYLLFLRKNHQSDNDTITGNEDELWPLQGSIEEKEALIDAILDEACMIEAFKDPTRKERFGEDK